MARRLHHGAGSSLPTGLMVGVGSNRVNSQTLEERLHHALQLEETVRVGRGTIPLVRLSGDHEGDFDPLRADRGRRGAEDLSPLDEPDVSGAVMEVACGRRDEPWQ